MKLTMVIHVNPADDFDDDDKAEFAKALQDTFEERYSADPTENHETADGEFSFDITSNSVTVSYSAE